MLIMVNTDYHYGFSLYLTDFYITIPARLVVGLPLTHASSWWQKL